MLTARVHTVVSVLNDLKDAFITLLEKPNKHPALLMMYAFIDICAALANDDPKKTNQAIFVAYLEAFMTPGSKSAVPRTDCGRRVRRCCTPLRRLALTRRQAKPARLSISLAGG